MGKGELRRGVREKWSGTFLCAWAMTVAWLALKLHLGVLVDRFPSNVVGDGIGQYNSLVWMSLFSFFLEVCRSVRRNKDEYTRL